MQIGFIVPRDIKSFMRKVFTKLIDVIFYMIIILIFIAVLAVLSYFLYFQSNTTKVIAGLPGMGDTRIEFDRVESDIFSNYPYGNFNFENFKLIDASEPEVEKFLVNAKQLTIDIKNATWEDKHLTIRKISLDNGEIYIHRDSLGHLNFNKIFNSADTDSVNTRGKKWTLNADSLHVDLKEMLLSYTADDKYKSVIFSVKNGNANIYKNADGSSKINSILDLIVDDFTLKQENGSFLKNANVKGPIDLRIDQEGVHIDQTTLNINNQELIASAAFYNHKEKYAYLHFINNNTNFEVIRPLLSSKLKQTLAPYKVIGTFKADARLTIMPAHPLRVDIDFVVPGNDIHIKNQVYTNTKMTGHFVNDNIYDRTFNKVITDKTYVRFDIIEGRTITKGAKIEIDSAVILAGKGHPASITSNAIIDGPTALISNQLENDEFIFDGGTFNVEAKLKGLLDDFQNMIEQSDLNLSINNSNVTYLPSEVVLPLKTFQLAKQAGDGEFKISGLTNDQVYSLVLDGSITNIIDIINAAENIQSVTNANLKAKRLSWEDFIHILGEGVFKKTNKSAFKKRRDMKKTLRGLQNHFQPTIQLEIDSSGYYDIISMENISALMHFPEKDILAIDAAAFDLEEGHIDFSCKYDISTDEKTPFEMYCNAVDINLSKLLPSIDFFGIDALRNLEFLPKDFDIKMRLSGVIDDSTGIVGKSLTADIVFNSTKRRVDYAHINFDRVDRFDSLENKMVKDLVITIQIKGNPHVINSYLNNEQFFFNEGDFELNVNYTGEQLSLNNIITDGEFTLTIDSSFVYYEPLSVTFPLTHIGLNVKKNDAKYNILLKSDSLNQEIKFDGKVQNISQLIVEDTGLPVQTSSNIYSPRITWKNFIEIFNTGVNEAATPVRNSESSLKTASGKFCELLYKFSPDLVIRFDTLEYSNDLFINNFTTNMLLKDSVFYVTDAKFNYRDSDILLNSTIHISDDVDSIDTKLNAERMDIKNLFNDIEDLSDKDLASINYMTGTLDIDANISQNFRANAPLNDTLINGNIDFTINDLVIHQAPWMDQLGKKVWHRKRFKHVKFAPITNQLTYINDSLHVSLMELQSNAFNVFVEGYYHSEHPNIWVSIPLYNFKKRDLSIVPPKEGYARRKNKIHMEYGIHKKPNPRFKLRLSKRKFYKDRGLLDEWKKRKKLKE